MTDHPSIPKLWIIDESSPSGVSNAHFDASNVHPKGRTSAIRSMGRHVGHQFENGFGRRYWRLEANVDGKRIQPLAHRVVWILANGPIPPGYEIDHVDNNPLNNKLENLRLATKSQNAMNKKRPRNNTTGLKGVRHSGYGRFCAVIRLDDTIHYLGTFDTKEEAHEAYCTKAKELHGLFHRAE
jgi:hypothetical protein